MMCFSRFILALLFLTASVKLSIASVQDDQALASKMIQRRAPQASDTSKSPDEQGPTEASAAHKKGSKNTKSGASKGGLSKQVDEFCTNILLAQENLSPLLIFDYPQWSGLSQHELLQKFEPICIKYIEDHYPDIMKLEHNSAGLKDPKTGKVWPKYQVSLHGTTRDRPCLHIHGRSRSLRQEHRWHHSRTRKQGRLRR